MIPAKILVVDDELEFERLIKQRLRKFIRTKEFELIFASNGREALEKLYQEKRAVDMVLTDINMPEMDGLTLLGLLPEIDPTLQAVVVSAYDDMRNIRTAMNLGAFDFLIKPIDFDDLITTTNRTLKCVQELRTNRDRLQQAQIQLVQSEKMSALGQLVASIAHEINNPIGFINGNLSQSEEYSEDLINHLQLYQNKPECLSSEIKEHAEEIDLDFLIEDLPKVITSMKMGTERIVNLSKSLRIFSRADSNQPVSFNVHDGIDSTLTILTHRLKADTQRPEIRVIKEYGALPQVECFPGQLNQVFMNLLSNAIDSINEACYGRSYLEIKACPHQIIITTEIKEDQHSILISIKDDGLGMSTEVKNKAFDHLFTTKKVGKGTGLGLSISRQIVVDKHKGKLHCIASPGEGAEFVIEIPFNG
ncbi:MAG: response regulator [Spirulinaceae cyanobacterium]